MEVMFYIVGTVIESILNVIIYIKLLGKLKQSKMDNKSYKSALEKALDTIGVVKIYAKQKS